MKKNYLILLALFLFQGSEICEAGPYERKMAAMEAMKPKQNSNPEVPNQDEEQRKEEQRKEEQRKEKQLRVSNFR